MQIKKKKKTKFCDIVGRWVRERHERFLTLHNKQTLFGEKRSPINLWTHDGFKSINSSISCILFWLVHLPLQTLNWGFYMSFASVCTLHFQILPYSTIQKYTLKNNIIMRQIILPRKRDLEKIQKSSPLAKDNAFGTKTAKVFQFPKKNWNFWRFYPILLNIYLESIVSRSGYKILPIHGFSARITDAKLQHAISSW